MQQQKLRTCHLSRGILYAETETAYLSRVFFRQKQKLRTCQEVFFMQQHAEIAYLSKGILYNNRNKYNEAPKNIYIYILTFNFHIS